MQAAIVLVTFFCSLLDKKRSRVIVFDDSPFRKDRSKALELLARCWDHIYNKYFKGFRLLNMIWTDGFSIVPLGFILLSSEKKENRYQEAKNNIDPRSNAGKRRADAVATGVNGVLKLFDMVSTILLGRYDAVVFDSWFAMNSLIENISKKTTVVCMVKKNFQLLFKYCGVEGSINQVYMKLKNKTRGRARIIGSCIVDLVIGKGKDKHSIRCKIVFVRHNSTSDWIPLLCTNTALSDEKIIELYSMRWSIETFHRDTKQFLDLEKDCQSTNYDALTSHVTIAYIQYTFLAYRQRLEEDKRKMGFGSLFYACCEEVKRISQDEAVLRTCADALRGIRAAARRTVDGEKLYTNDQVVEAVLSALANYQQSCSSVEATIKVLIERQESIEKFGQSLAARARGQMA